MSDRTPRRQHELQLRIRKTAYLLWEAAGGHHGRSLEFWLAAEREVLASRARSEARKDAPESSASGVSDEATEEASDREAAAR
jgi:dsDNA-binding SOS-regulon protein